MRSGYYKNYYPAEHSGVCVVRRKNESDEDLLRRFRKKYSKSGISRELKERMAYQKPSDKKRRKRLQAQRLRKKEERRMEIMRERYLKRRRKQQRKGTRYHDRGNRQYGHSEAFTERKDIRRNSATG